MWSLLIILLPLKFLCMHRWQIYILPWSTHEDLKTLFLYKSWGEGADKNMGGLTNNKRFSFIFSCPLFIVPRHWHSLLFCFNFFFVHSYLQDSHLYFLLIWKQTWRNISWIPRLCQFMTFIRRKGIWIVVNNHTHKLLFGIGDGLILCNLYLFNIKNESCKLKLIFSLGLLNLINTKWFFTDVRWSFISYVCSKMFIDSALSQNLSLFFKAYKVADLQKSIKLCHLKIILKDSR